jgi:hypothetical protein
MIRAFLLGSFDLEAAVVFQATFLASTSYLLTCT